MAALTFSARALADAADAWRTSPRGDRPWTRCSSTTGRPAQTPEERTPGGAAHDRADDTAPAGPARTRGRSVQRLRWSLADTWTVTGRDLAHWVRQPATLVLNLLMVMVVLLFGYLFGGAMTVPGGGSYREFLLPGMFALVACSSASRRPWSLSPPTPPGASPDRFRHAHGSVWPAAAACYRRHAQPALGLAVLLACGLLVGWGWHRGAADALAAVGLLLLLRSSPVAGPTWACSSGTWRRWWPCRSRG